MKRILTALLAGVMLTAPMAVYAQTEDSTQSITYQQKLESLRNILYRCSIVTLIPPWNYYYNEYLLIDKYTSVQEEINGTEPVSEERLDTLREELLREIENFARIGDGYGQYKLGDIDHNGRVDVSDATYLQRAIIDDTQKEVRKLNDINGDRYTNIIDVTELQRGLAGESSLDLEVIKQVVWYTYEGYEYKYRANLIRFYPLEEGSLLTNSIDMVMDVRDSEGNYIYQDAPMQFMTDRDGRKYFELCIDNDKPYLLSEKTYTLTFRSGQTGYQEKVTPEAFTKVVNIEQDADNGGFLWDL